MATLITGNFALDMTASYTTSAISSMFETFSTEVDRTSDNNHLYLQWSGEVPDLVAGTGLSSRLLRVTLHEPDSPGAWDPSDPVIFDVQGISIPVLSFVPYVNTTTGRVDVKNALSLVLAGNDTLTGGALGDKLLAFGGNDVLTGGGGNDTLFGLGGNDTYYIDDPGDVVAEASGQGIDTVFSPFTFSLATGAAGGTAFAENLTLTGTNAVNGIGNGVANVLIGNVAANELIGGLANDTLAGNGEQTMEGGMDDGAADTLIGGAGSDTYFVAGADQVIEVSGGGTDLAVALSDFTLPANLDNLTLGGSGDTRGTGNELLNIIRGNSGDNTIDGAGGADTMDGRNGDDEFVVDNVNDKVVEIVTGGISDGITSTVSYTLPANVERLTLGGSANINGTGNALANTLTGNSGNNVLNGLGGALGDTMAGGGGDDTYFVDDSDDTVTEAAAEGFDVVKSSVSFTIGAGNEIEKVILTGTAAVNATGNEIANELVGNAAANSLAGGGGNDTLNGMAGADTLVGGEDGDLYFVDAASDRVQETGTSGTDEIRSSVTINLGADGAPGVVELASRAGIENVMLLGSGAANIVGNGLGNVLTGNAAANVLDGGAGADTLIGNAGNDLYVVDSVDDVVQETIAGAAGGVDTVRSSVSFELAADGLNVEHVVLLAGAGDIDATGSGGANRLTGNEGENVLDGGGGADTLIGGAGNDTYHVNVAGDSITEAAGSGPGFTDTVVSSISYALGATLENLTLAPGAGSLNATGNAAPNALTGNEGSNVLNGLAGADTMAGGDGNDTYVVDNASEQLSEDLGQGTDTVRASVGWTLGENFENLVLIGTAAISGTGNTQDNTLTGNAAANSLAGGGGNDTLSGGSGSDILQGGPGDDRFIFDAADIAAGAADGGAGNDTLVLAGAGQTLNLIAAPDGRYLGIEVVDLTGTGANTLLLNPSDVLAITGSALTPLVVDGNPGDVLRSTGQGWTNTGTQTAGAVTYATFEHASGAELWVDTEMGFTVT